MGLKNPDGTNYFGSFSEDNAADNTQPQSYPTVNGVAVAPIPNEKEARECFERWAASALGE
ncbi:hypothetical protein [Mesorhizobium sp. B2-3-2]|uniref:hypothetical protein n=1 Tax=Mesorhizobium sp. B2-3-2 TaxID=2589961 RepID=UPI00112623BF|nr:hypothetical protein [Mesorhizobium sp. B2-3-2]TPM37058.1 hypothetical protein FJ964_30455 [Mesorhizobium sp. B2-3-2]